MYMLGISFWVDEVKLAEGIVNHPMNEMLTPPLDNRQSAPVLYLVVVKTLSMLFGTSESVLRVFSLFSLILMLVLQGVLLRKVFHISMVFTLFSVAVSATFSHYMYYSNELKPYMGDAAFVLIIFIGYYAYREGLFGRGLRSAIILGSICSACILFSSPAIFAAAAVFIVQFFSRCIKKDRAAVISIIFGGLILIASFAINYFIWLRPVATDELTIEFWTDSKLNFLMLSRADLIHNISIFRNLLLPVWDAVWIAVPFGIFGFLISLVKRNVYTVVAGVFFFLLLIASAVGKYPISPRLWMFFYVILFIYVFIFIDAIRLSFTSGIAVKAVKTVIPLLIAFILLIPNLTTFTDYGKGEDWLIQPGSQANPLIAYVEENIREGEFLYSFYSANYILRYKIGYEINKIGNVENDNIIFGTMDLKTIDNDIEKITETDGAYILLYHDKYQRFGPLIERLQKRGFVELILDINDTYLYWFTNDIARVKTSVKINMSDITTDEGKLSGVLAVENTGASIIAPEKPRNYMAPVGDYDLRNYGRVFIVLQGPDEQPNLTNVFNGTILGEITTPVKPGEKTEVAISIDGLEPGEYQIELVAYGKYLFSEIGTVPITVFVKG